MAMIAIFSISMFVFTTMVPAASAVGVSSQQFDVSGSPCLSSYSSSSGTLDSQQGPSGETWTVVAKVGLPSTSSDYTQNAAVRIILIDDTPQEWVAHFGVVHNNWVTDGGVNIASMTVEIGSTLDIQYYIYNNDSQSQCFSLEAFGWYWT
ncbi:MAG TPA: hypothetical protein VGS23_02715 [Thermoplasmata archaeon]|nr:hypothetical protein [Thermoplasmata archaeon]